MELRVARRLARLTQQELAQRAGVDDSFISLIENGKRDIRSVGYETVVRIARALGVEADQLWPIEPFTPASAPDETPGSAA